MRKLDDQTSELDENDAMAILEAIRAGPGNAQVDWVNRTIRVLSVLKRHPTRTLSGNRPLEYRDILFNLQ